MRIWSIHPKYLDAKGLVALWREALLAQAVLSQKTKGYKNHPQLLRFKMQSDPIGFIGTYLHFVYVEARKRGYSFDRSKIECAQVPLKKRISVTDGQCEFEFKHLVKKLKSRSPQVYRQIKKERSIQLHPLFRRKSGSIEEWEIID